MSSPAISIAGRRCLVVALVPLLAIAGLVASARDAGASHGIPYGQQQGIATAVGPAWPGPTAWWAGTCDLLAGSTTGGGVGPSNGGSAPPAPPAIPHCIAQGTAHPGTGSQVWAIGEAPSWRLDPMAEAGAHPDSTATFWLRRAPHGPNPGFAILAEGDLKTVVVKLPAGVIGNPMAVPKCPAELLNAQPPACPPETQVGVASVTLATSPSPGAPLQQGAFPVWNVEPRAGNAGEVLFSPLAAAARANIPIVAKPRTDGDFGIDAIATNLPGGFAVLGQAVTLWGVPWAAAHDSWRVPAGQTLSIPAGGQDGSAGRVPVSYDPSWGPIRPFMTNPTECDPAVPTSLIEIDSWQFPGTFHSASAPADAAIRDCASVAFDPSFGVQTTSTVADAPSGLSADLTVPQNNDPPPAVAANPSDTTGAPAHWRSVAGRSTAQVDRVTVTLPEGFSVNPAGATGLAGCSNAEIGVTNAGSNPLVFNDEDPFDGAGAECPAGSRIGTAEIRTPLLEETLTGDFVLGTPTSTDPESGGMFRLFIVARNKERGLVAKIAGSATADRDTGQLVATFDKNPRLPVDSVHVDLKGGPRGMLATPQACAPAHAWGSQLTPWTAAHGGGGTAVPQAGSFVIDANCALGFDPDAIAGMSSQRGGGSGTLDSRLVRDDGERYVQGVTVEMPTGLLASSRGVPLCSDAAAAAGNCPAASRIGSASGAAGAGNPFFLERDGDVYLTEGYKGGSYGLMIRLPVEAGPFRGEFALAPIVIRLALHIDRSDAHVTAISDPLPQIWHGIPLRVRQATVRIDRRNFMRNPTDCAPKRIRTVLSAAGGSSVERSTPFQASRCADLPFKPKLTMRLVGRKQLTTGKHPGVQAVFRAAGRSEAATRRAEVRLPGSLALDPNNAQALCEFVDGTKPDLENHCPKGSIVGRARVISPLLEDPLTGNVYFVKNVKRLPNGAQVRTLPMIIVALRGEIAVNVRGVTDVKRGRLVNTFADLPDAALSRFTLNIDGGRNGILAVTRTRRAKIDICKGRQLALALVDGHNGRRRDSLVHMKTPCKKPQGKPPRKGSR